MATPKKPPKAKTPQNPTKSHTWGPLQQKALNLYLEGTPFTEIGKQVNRSRFTIGEWSKFPEWVAGVEQYNQELEAWRKTVAGAKAQAAIIGLDELLKEEDTPPEVKARILIQYGKWGGLDQPQQLQISGSLKDLTIEQLKARRQELQKTLNPTEPDPDGEEPDR